MKNACVYIVIVNWNGKEDTLKCLSSLQHLSENTTLKKKIIIVDNGSVDNSVVEITRKFPECIVVSLKENTGFTGANNIGITEALKNNADYIWLLNNDTLVHRDALEQLIKPFEHSRTGITVSKIYFMEGREFHYDRYTEKDRGNVLWYAGGKIDWNNMYGSHRGVDEIDKGQYEEEIKTEYASGCSFCISKECIESVGMFDERYFAYLEDMDLSVRAIRAGFDVIYTPKSKVWHKNAGSTARPGNNLHQYYMTRNRLLFGKMYASLRTQFALLRESIHFLIHGTKTQKQGVIDAFTGKWGKQFSWK